MRSALVLIVLAALTGACAKKQSAAKSPANTTTDSEKASGAPGSPAPEAPASDSAPTKTQRVEDPCTGGERPH